jgi:hypothetical protein
MKSLFRYLRDHRQVFGGTLFITIVCVILDSFRVGSLVTGISSGEQRDAATPIGWHGIVHIPFNLPLELMRSLLRMLYTQQSAVLIRLPSVVLSIITVLAVCFVMRIWYGNRIALLGGILLATASWTLHVGRLGSDDALYFCSLPLLLCSQIVLNRYRHHWAAQYGSLLVWGLLLYVPGLFWLIAATIIIERKNIVTIWRQFHSWWRRGLYGVAVLIWLPLLIKTFITNPHRILLWLGAPLKLPTPLHYVRQFGGVWIHLFIRGPAYPQLWLGRLPLLDAFTLCVTIIGLYFYARRSHSRRTHILAVYVVLGVMLIALGGAVPLSLLVPVLYIIGAGGIAYLLHLWFTVFPFNPFARRLGLTVMVVAVAVSCTYNIRAYFIAWPNAPTTVMVFHLKD